MTEDSKQVATIEPTISRADPYAMTAGGRVAPIIPRNVHELATIAGAVIKANLVPRSYEDPNPDRQKSKIMIGIMKGAEVGLPPITALSTIAVINGRPCLWGDGAVALIQQSGKLEKMQINEVGTMPKEGDGSADFKDDYGIEVKMWRIGQSEPYVGRFTVGDAKRAHLWMNTSKKPWVEYPRRQMKWRAFGWAARDGFADCLMGLGIREEVEDLPEAPKHVDAAILSDEAPEETSAIEGLDQWTVRTETFEDPKEASAEILRLIRDVAMDADELEEILVANKDRIESDLKKSRKEIQDAVKERRELFAEAGRQGDMLASG